MSELLVTSIYNQEGEGAPSFPKGATSTGVITATSFSGSGANLTGIDATALKDTDGNVKIQAEASGVVVTGILTATGSVSVGGTLTYEDVTNVDSVGLITARNGIHVTGNIGLGGATYGTSGQVLTSGGSGANATWTTISSAPEFAGIASGSITGGQSVCVADDGKLMGVTGYNEAKGTSTDEDVSNSFAIVYDTAADKYVLFFRDNNNGDYGQARVGTLSGTTITWGAKQQFVGNSVNPSMIKAIYDSTNNKCVVLYRDNTNSNKGSVVVCSLSGDTLTFGAPVVNITEQSGGMEYNSFCYCPDTDNYSIVYNNSSGNNGYCKIGKYTGTNSSTWPNASVQFLSGQARGTGQFYDTTADKLCVMMHHGGDSNHGYIVAGTVASDTVTFGSYQKFDATNADGAQYSGVHDSSTGKNVLCYSSLENSKDLGKCRTATLSGTVFTFGAESKFTETSFANKAVIGYKTSANKFLVAYADNDYSNNVFTRITTLNGTTITFGTAYQFTTGGSGNTADSSIVFNPDTLSFVTLFATANTKLSYYVENIRVSNLTSGNYVGIANASYTNGQTASIALPGAVNTAVSGLTVGQKYYAVADGTLNATADSANIDAGNAIATNKLLVR